MVVVFALGGAVTQTFSLSLRARRFPLNRSWELTLAAWYFKKKEPPLLEQWGPGYSCPTKLRRKMNTS